MSAAAANPGTSGNAGASATFELRAGDAGKSVLRISGSLDVHSTAALWRELDEKLHQTPVATLDVDASGIDHCDGAGLALLQFLGLGGMSPSGGHPTVTGLRPQFASLFQRFSADDYSKNLPQLPEHGSLLAEVGRAYVVAVDDWKAEVAFVGQVTAGLAANFPHPKKMRWREVRRIFETAGVNALPIVSLISLLVGLIIAFEAAGPFEMFGAQIFIANMIGIIMARELSGLMTGVILAGRSGSAFAAELGTMKVNEELNALETMGLDPVRFLVVQRVLAGVLLTPLLTIYSIFVSIFGGVLVMMAMGFPLVAIYNQMAMTLHYRDILIGVGKGVIFGALIAGIGCLRGLQTKKGPSAVGESATRSVVSGILLIIIADAVVAVLLYFLHL